MTKRVADLTGAELDRWVANAHGMMLYTPDWQPSRNWAQGGPLIRQDGISVLYRGKMPFDGRRYPPEWAACKADGRYQFGDTPLEAAMRCYVASKLGDEVDDESI